jgi:hypothetical protein
MNFSKKAKRILEWKPGGSRRTGRSRIRCLDDVCNDMKEINMKKLDGAGAEQEGLK